MQLRRVVITGMGVVSPFGRGVDSLINALMAGKSGVKSIPELEEIEGLRSKVAALVEGVDPKKIPRKYRRSMSGMSIYAYLACKEALHQAGLESEEYSNGSMGIVIGSTISSITTLQEFFEHYLEDHNIEQSKTSTFFKAMNNSCASNISHALGIDGRILALSAACSTGCQAVGYGYEMVAFGKQKFALCGGSEEYHPLTTATFDIMNAGSIKYNNEPGRTPRPFDRDRDGVVCSEGCGIILLETLESALKRGAKILAEVIGFATVSNPTNLATPSSDSMEVCMLKAMEESGIKPDEIDYINAHATGTEQGDIAESEAIGKIFGSKVPVSSLKGHIGHAMAASGSLEIASTVEMINRDCIIPNLNLENIDDLCKNIHVITRMENRKLQIVMKNSFAFGGVNSSIILRRYIHE